MRGYFLVSYRSIAPIASDEGLRPSSFADMEAPADTSLLIPCSEGIPARPDSLFVACSEAIVSFEFP